MNSVRKMKGKIVKGGAMIISIALILYAYISLSLAQTQLTTGEFLVELTTQSITTPSNYCIHWYWSGDKYYCKCTLGSYWDCDFYKPTCNSWANTAKKGVEETFTCSKGKPQISKIEVYAGNTLINNADSFGKRFCDYVIVNDTVLLKANVYQKVELRKVWKYYTKALDMCLDKFSTFSEESLYGYYSCQHVKCRFFIKCV